MKPSEKNNAEAPSSTAPYDYLGNSCSSLDCTGLIPTPPADEAQAESYKALYPFGPPAINPEKSEKEPAHP